MNRNTMIRIITMILCAAYLMLPVYGGTAEEGGNGEADLLNKLRTVQDFKFQNHKDGIGTGICAVYSAPSNSSLRFANGRASCDLADEVDEAGYDHGWLLVRYKTSGEQIRVGYIRRETAGNFKSSMPAMECDPIPLTAAVSIRLIEAPSENSASFGTINAGDTFYVLRKYTYTGSWWYVECTVEGKTARGFIDRNEASFYLGAGTDPESGATLYELATLGYPEISPRNSGVIGHFEVGDGPRKLVWDGIGGNSNRITVAYAGRYYPCYDAAEDDDGKTWYYIWVEEDSKWGWILSINGELIRD